MFWKFQRSSSPDYSFIAFLIILVVFGLVMLTSASSDVSQAKFGDSFYYLKHQILFGLLPGLVGFFIADIFQLSELEEMGVTASLGERRSSASGVYAARLQGLWFRALAQYRRLQHPAGRARQDNLPHLHGSVDKQESDP